MKLIGLLGLLLLLFLELLDCRWDLRQVIVYSGNFLVDSVEFLKEQIALGCQLTFGFLQIGLRLVW